MIDIDECEDESMNDCDINANCSNSIGSYNCFCFDGFEGSGFNCSGIAPRHVKRYNDVGTALLTIECHYPDIDECTRELDNCDINAECTNTIGGYNCTCNIGYTGSGFMSDCSECCLD